MSYATSLKELLTPGTLMVFVAMFIAFLALAISFISVTNKKSRMVAIGLTIISFIIMIGLLALAPVFSSLL